MIVLFPAICYTEGIKLAERGRQMKKRLEAALKLRPIRFVADVVGVYFGSHIPIFLKIPTSLLSGL